MSASKCEMARGSYTYSNGSNGVAPVSEAALRGRENISLIEELLENKPVELSAADESESELAVVIANNTFHVEDNGVNVSRQQAIGTGSGGQWVSEYHRRTYHHTRPQGHSASLVKSESQFSQCMDNQNNLHYAMAPRVDCMQQQQNFNLDSIDDLKPQPMMDCNPSLMTPCMESMYNIDYQVQKEPPSYMAAVADAANVRQSLNQNYLQNQSGSTSSSCMRSSGSCSSMSSGALASPTCSASSSQPSPSSFPPTPPDSQPSSPEHDAVRRTSPPPYPGQQHHQQHHQQQHSQHHHQQHQQQHSQHQHQQQHHHHHPQVNNTYPRSNALVIAPAHHNNTTLNSAQHAQAHHTPRNTSDIISPDFEVPLTPVTHRPRKTHPGCTTIKYNRRNNPDLDKRRIHFCDFMGKWMYITLA